MSKTIVQSVDYTFDKTAKTVTLSGAYTGIEISNIELITNVEDNVIIYQFNKPSKGGVLAGLVLTLDYDTTSMSNGDPLMIIIESDLFGSSGGLTDAELRASPVDVDTGLLQGLTDVELRATPLDVDVLSLPPGTSTEAKQDEQIATIQDLYNQLSIALDRLEFGLITDNRKQLKVNLVDSGALPSITALGTVTTVTTVTTVGSVSSVANTARQGDLQMQRVNEALLDTAFISGITNNITF